MYVLQNKRIFHDIDPRRFGRGFWRKSGCGGNSTVRQMNGRTGLLLTISVRLARGVAAG